MSASRSFTLRRAWTFGGSLRLFKERHVLMWTEWLAVGLFQSSRRDSVDSYVHDEYESRYFFYIRFLRLGARFVGFVI